MFGSLAWARAGGGRLSLGERLGEAGRGLGVLAGSLGRRFGLGDRRRIERALAEIPRPDTPAARAADDLCAAASSPALAGHCRRTYLWGALLGLRDGLAFDPELFLVACLLHDLGLTPRFAPDADPSRPLGCFAWAGAEAAERWAIEQGWAAARRDALAGAICLHLNARVDSALGVEAHLLRQGSAVDVIGLRLPEVARATRAEVLERHPRLGFKAEIAALARRERRLRPRSRMGCLVALGFARQIDASPFAD